ncbi:MAG: mandelate racemase/muconate lactonizing enzyme family protein [Opitutales bacterium]
MKITDLRAVLLSCPMPEPVELPFHGGKRTIFKRDALYVKVSAEGGLAGFGPGAASEINANFLNGQLRELLVGRDIGDPVEFMAEACACLGDQAFAAAGAVEVALYDLWGKAEGCSVTEFLGGRKQDSIRCYGSAGMYQTAEQYAEEAAAVCEGGCEAYKYRPALGPDEDVRTVQLMREALGPEVGVCMDAHAWWRMGDHSYGASTTEEVARAVSDLGVTWLEEPLPVEDRAAYAALRDKGIVPVAAGEHEHDVEGFRELVGGGCVDFAQADVSHHGGFSGLSEILRICEGKKVVFAFHNWGTALETVADALIGSCFPRETAAWLEYPVYAHRDPRVMYPYPLSDELVPDAPVPEDGEFPLPEGPGLGVTVDEAMSDKYPYLPGPWSVFELESPPTKLALSGDHALPWAGDETA